MQEGKTRCSTNSAIFMHYSQRTIQRRLVKLLRMIKYIQEKRYDKLTLKINDMNMSYWYADADFAVHANIKIHMVGVLTMGKGAIKTISMKQNSNKKVPRLDNWYQQMTSYHICCGPVIS